jgi:hypothetical protein
MPPGPLKSLLADQEDVLVPETKSPRTSLHASSPWFTIVPAHEGVVGQAGLVPVMMM